MPRSAPRPSLDQIDHAARTLMASGDGGDALVSGALVALIAGEPADEALGLERLDDQRRAERDRLIRAARARHGMSYPALVTLIERYEAAAWRHERQLPECPPARLDTPEEFAWRVLRLGLGAPSARTVRRAISGHGPPFGGRST